MEVSDERVALVIEGFQAAGVGTGSWLDALDGLAAITGSTRGQLAGIGAEAARPFNWLTKSSVEMLEEFVHVGGTDPQINPRGRAMRGAAELQVLADADFSHSDDRLKPEYADWVRRHDVPFICMAPLLRHDDLLVGLSVVRTQAQGHVGDLERRLFATVAPHARQAVRTQIHLQAQGAALVAESMDALSIPVFVCDSHGRVRALSSEAEALAAEGRRLKLRNGRLAAATEGDSRALAAAVHEAAFARALAPRRAPTVLVVNGEGGAEPLLVEVAPVPGERHGFGLGVAALVIARTPRKADTRAAAIARALYGLTQAEAAVVADLMGGLSPHAIAEQAGVSVGTVRTHIRHIFDKAGVRSQVELVANMASRM